MSAGPWKTIEQQTKRVIPANAGIQLDLACVSIGYSNVKLIPAFAGMTVRMFALAPADARE